MQFHVITLFPEMVVEACAYGVVGQAIKDGKMRMEVINPRAFTSDVHRSVDDRPFGGGDGMVMLPEPLDAAIEHVESKVNKKTRVRKICLSARGRPFNDQLARELASEEELILVCGRYGGIDQRLIEERQIEEVSIGDFVLSGGELGALVIVDAIGRLLPGVLGNSASPHEESFANGLLEHPQFTRPRVWKGLEVPEAILSGNHAKIGEWRQALSVLSTAQTRPDLLKASGLDQKLAKKTLSVLESLSPNDRRACGLKDDAVLRDRLMSASSDDAR